MKEGDPSQIPNRTKNTINPTFHLEKTTDSSESDCRAYSQGDKERDLPVELRLGRVFVLSSTQAVDLKISFKMFFKRLCSVMACSDTEMAT